MWVCMEVDVGVVKNQVQYQVICIPTGTTCDGKSITAINKYNNRKLTGIYTSCLTIEIILK